jgi:uncharacterized protein YdbL (DUF1318 family)
MTGLSRRAFIRATAMGMALLGTTVYSVAVHALSVAQAKRDGLVTEKPNGYLAVSPGKGNPEVHRLVKDTNAKRKAKYQQIARRLKIDLSLVEADFGKKLGGK